MGPPPGSAKPPPRGRRPDPLGLWLCGLAVLGLARAWLYLVRDAGLAGPVGWIWLGGSIVFACLGLRLLVGRGRAWSSRCRNRARPVFDRIPRAGPDSPPGAATTTIRPIRPLRSSPMVDPVRSPQHAPRDLPTELPAALDPAKEARELLEVGSRWGRDDYDARATAFAEAIRQGDADYQQALVAELLGQDSNAFNSWMTPARINSLVDSGQISLTERGAM